jgi:two-component system response regulator HydG
MLGDGNGLDLLRQLRELFPELSVFLITGYGSVETAVEAMQEGAADYLTKPVNLGELRTRVTRELEKLQLAQDNAELRQALDKRYGLEGMVGNAPNMQRVFDLVRQAGPTDATVLVLGESGTGKELIANALHRLSKRAARKYLAINCAALTESLIESELFGHIKGAFTGAIDAKVGKFEYAEGGTLFLDEIGDMPLATQAKLLRVLENREVIPVGSNAAKAIDVRIVAATNRDLQKRVQSGDFREDLYYRLAVVQIDMPALHERVEDLPLLVDFFMQEMQDRHGKKIHSIAEPVLRVFREHKWPGNVRELRNAVETMVVLDSDGELGLDDMPIMLRDQAAALADVTLPTAPEPKSSLDTGYELLGKTLAEVEKDLLLQTLEALGGNRQKAASQLGIGERTLYRKLKEYHAG